MRHLILLISLATGISAFAMQQQQQATQHTLFSAFWKQLSDYAQKQWEELQKLTTPEQPTQQQIQMPPQNVQEKLMREKIITMLSDYVQKNKFYHRYSDNIIPMEDQRLYLIRVQQILPLTPEWQAIRSPEALRVLYLLKTTDSDVQKVLQTAIPGRFEIVTFNITQALPQEFFDARRQAYSAYIAQNPPTQATIKAPAELTRYLNKAKQELKKNHPYLFFALEAFKQDELTIPEFDAIYKSVAAKTVESLKSQHASLKNLIDEILQKRNQFIKNFILQKAAQQNVDPNQVTWTEQEAQRATNEFLQKIKLEDRTIYVYVSSQDDVGPYRALRSRGNKPSAYQAAQIYTKSLPQKEVIRQNLIFVERITMPFTLIDQLHEIAKNIQNDLVQRKDSRITQEQFTQIFGADIRKALSLKNEITVNELRQTAEAITASLEYQGQKTLKETQEKAGEFAEQAKGYIGTLFSNIWERGKTLLGLTPEQRQAQEERRPAQAPQQVRPVVIPPQAEQRESSEEDIQRMVREAEQYAQQERERKQKGERQQETEAFEELQKRFLQEVEKEPKEIIQPAAPQQEAPQVEQQQLEELKAKAMNIYIQYQDTFEKLKKQFAQAQKPQEYALVPKLSHYNDIRKNLHENLSQFLQALDASNLTVDTKQLQEYNNGLRNEFTQEKNGKMQLEQAFNEIDKALKELYNKAT